MTEEDLEYCPDCDTAVSYNDDGEVVCECEWEEDVGVPYSQEEWLAELKAKGMKWRHSDPTYICVSRKGWGINQKDIFVKKATLGHLHRIERLRWQCYLNMRTLLARRHNLRKEVSATDNRECFIPVDWDEVESWKKGHKGKEPLTEEAIARYSNPRRIVIESNGDEWYTITRPHGDFFAYEEPKHSGTEMEVIAVATHLGEWEQEILPDRIKRSQDPIKLALGKRWQHLDRRETALGNRCHFMNELLSLAITTLEILPEGPDFVRKRSHVRLNGRAYPFDVGKGYSEPAYKFWPTLDDLNDVFPPETFAVDESLVGIRADAVQARLGEPERVDNLKWIYASGTVVFAKSSYERRVERIEQPQLAGSTR